eukprot:5604175-Pleurochrysis_carterae.AAC.1
MDDGVGIGEALERLATAEFLGRCDSGGEGAGGRRIGRAAPGQRKHGGGGGGDGGGGGGDGGGRSGSGGRGGRGGVIGGGGSFNGGGANGCGGEKVDARVRARVSLARCALLSTLLQSAAAPKTSASRSSVRPTGFELSMSQLRQLLDFGTPSGVGRHVPIASWTPRSFAPAVSSTPWRRSRQVATTLSQMHYAAAASMWLRVLATRGGGGDGCQGLGEGGDAFDADGADGSCDAYESEDAGGNSGGDGNFGDCGGVGKFGDCG